MISKTLSILFQINKNYDFFFLFGFQRKLHTRENYSLAFLRKKI